MKTKIPQLKTKIPMINGIFSHMDYDFAIVDASQLDVLFINTYGERNVAPLVTNFLINDIPTDDELTSLGTVIKSIYSKKWDRFLEIHRMEYDVIHNYLDEYTETSEADNVVTGSMNSTVTNTGTDGVTGTNTRTDDLSKTSTKESENVVSDSEDASVYAFNSENSVKSDESSSDSTSTLDETTTVTDTGTQTVSKDETRTVNMSKETEGSNETTTKVTRERTFTHKGNIGNLTTQEMLRQEIKLWEWNFVESVLTDVKDLLTIPMYLQSSQLDRKGENYGI